jgi:protein-disulfide isomerase
VKKIAGFMVMVLFWSSCALAAEVKRYQIPLETSPVIGPANAPITIVEFIDYQ